MNKLHIYIAGSLFSEADQDARRKEEEMLVDRLGDKITLYNPLTAPFNESKHELPTALEIYLGDYGELLKTDILMVDLGNLPQDTGVAAEIGLFAALSSLGLLTNDKERIIVAHLSDIRMSTANQYSIPSHSLNHFLLGCIESTGVIVSSRSAAIEYIESLVEKRLEAVEDLL